MTGQNYAGVIPYTEFTSLAAKQVCLGGVKRATCTDFVLKRKLFSAFATTFCNLQRPNLLKGKFDSWVLKCTKSLFGSFSAMLQNKLHVFVALFTVP